MSKNRSKAGGPWSEAEHVLFLMGLMTYGRGDWRSISANYVKTRTPSQIASHAQKYYIRIEKNAAKAREGGGSAAPRKNRSILNLTTANAYRLSHVQVSLASSEPKVMDMLLAGGEQAPSKGINKMEPPELMERTLPVQLPGMGKAAAANIRVGLEAMSESMQLSAVPSVIKNGVFPRTKQQKQSSSRRPLDNAKSSLKDVAMSVEQRLDSLLYAEPTWSVSSQDDAFPGTNSRSSHTPGMAMDISGDSSKIDRVIDSVVSSSISQTHPFSRFNALLDGLGKLPSFALRPMDSTSSSTTSHNGSQASSRLSSRLFLPPPVPPSPSINPFFPAPSSSSGALPPHVMGKRKLDGTIAIPIPPPPESIVPLPLPQQPEGVLSTPASSLSLIPPMEPAPKRHKPL